MAGPPIPDRFANFEVQIPGDPSDPAFNPGASNQNGLSDKQRFVLQNLFDTQLDRRRGYLKQLGYEMSQDGEEYRPIAHEGKFQPIDPGFDLFSAENAMQSGGRGFFDPAKKSFKNLFTAEGKKEFARDVGDVFFDLGAGAMVGAAGTAAASVGGAAGAVGGGAVGGPIGAAIGGAGGALVASGTAGAAANAGVEVFKKALGDMYLDEDIPMNMKDLIFQSGVAGAFSLGGEALGMTLTKFKKMGADNLKKSLAEAFARRSNGQVNPDLVLDFMTNPERYAPDKVKGATAKMVDFADYVFGTDVEHPKLGKSLKGGVSSKVMNDLNARAEASLTELSHNPEAHFTVDEILNVAKDEIGDLSRLKFRSPEQDEALSYLNQQLSEVKAKQLIKPEGEAISTIIDPSTGKPFNAGPSGPPEYEELPFDEVRQLLGRWQKATFQKGGSMTENPIVARMAHELRVKTDEKATSVGSNFAAINAKRSEILTAKQGLLDVAKGNDFYNAYLGKSKESKIRVQRALENTDRLLDTRLQEGAQTLQYQKAIENMYESPTAFGSGGELADAMRGGLKGGTTGAIQAATVGGTVSSAVGLPRSVGSRLLSAVVAPGRAIREAKVAAAFTSPDVLVKKVSKINNRIDDLSKFPKNMGLIRGGAGVASQQTEGPVRDFVGPPAAPVAAAAPAPPESAAPPTAGAGLPDRFKDFKPVIPEGL